MAANSGEPFSSQPVPAPYAPPPVAPARRRSPWLWVGLGCAGLILLSICGFIAVSAGLIGALAGAKTPTPAISGGTSVPAGQSSGLAGVGQTSTKGNWAVTLDKVDRTQRVGSSTTAPQGIYLVVYVTVKNVGKESYPLNDHDDSVTTASGTKYNTVSVATGQTLGDYKVPFLGQTVQPDLSAKNAVVFDVPPDAKDLTLDVQGNKFRLPNP